MSPMIDLVFLLLIFFMVASKLITFKKDENVLIPIVFEGQVPESIEGRVIINVYQDGTVYDEESRPMTLEDVTRVMAEAKAANPDAKLHLRGDARVPEGKVRDVVRASAEGGVSSVIFSTHDQ
ncbi:MAG: biopolymer transport protein ExbD [Verrucomicrobiales bacterium]|jgi:biopolymer transport protein ExbD